MTVNELYKQLEDIVNEGGGDMPIILKVMSGGLCGCNNVTVKALNYGFDWDHGKVVLHATDTLLTAAYAERRREAARKAGERAAKKDDEEAGRYDDSH